MFDGLADYIMDKAKDLREIQNILDEDYIKHRCNRVENLGGNHVQNIYTYHRGIDSINFFVLKPTQVHPPYSISVIFREEHRISRINGPAKIARLWDGRFKKDYIIVDTFIIPWELIQNWMYFSVDGGIDVV